MVAPREIGNIGTDAHERYAKDQNTDTSYIKEAGKIPPQTEIDVSTPFAAGELDLLLKAQPTHISWSSFAPPQAYNEQRKRLFTSQMTPTIGPEGKWETQSQKALEKLNAIPDEPSSENIKESTQKTPKKILTAVVTTIKELNKSLIDINSKRTQYQKG